MNCPYCNHKQVCPCKACNNAPALKPWVWVTGDGPISCGNCGLTESIDYWSGCEEQPRQDDIQENTDSMEEKLEALEN